MSQPDKAFVKADSIVALHQKTVGREAAIVRIRHLRDRLSSENSDQSVLVRQACDEVLTGGPAEVTFHLRDHVAEEIRRHSDDELARYLFYRYRYDMFPVRKQLDDYPPCVQIEPASICNYRCVFCYQIDDDFTRPKGGHMGLMTFDLFKQVIDQLQGRVDAVTLASRGEPLIAPEIVRMLEYVGEKFLALKINTNAWYLDEPKAHAILSADVNTLVFSADAAEEPLYSQLRVNGKLERVVKNIELFNRIRHRHYPHSRLITRVSGVRYTETQDFNSMDNFWGNMVDQVAFVDYNPWENTYERGCSGVDAACSDLWRRLFVWWDGTVNPCDVDYKSTLAVGNVKQTPVSDLWRSERYQALREAHLQSRRSSVFPCNRCTVV